MAFDWEHNLGHHKTYIGDQTLYAYFEDGFTVTFNPNGGRLKAENPAVCDKVFSAKRIAKIEQMNLSSDVYTYDGTVKTPQVIVKDSDGELLKQNKDYVVTYAEGRKKVGNYSITIKLKENYSGEVKKHLLLSQNQQIFLRCCLGRKSLLLNGRNRQNRQMAIRYSTVLLLNLKVQRISSYQRIKERVKRFQNLKQRKSII